MNLNIPILGLLWPGLFLVCTASAQSFKETTGYSKKKLPDHISITVCKDKKNKMTILNWYEKPHLIEKSGGTIRFQEAPKSYRVITNIDCSALPQYGRIKNAKGQVLLTFTCAENQMRMEEHYFQFSKQEKKLVQQMWKDTKKGLTDIVIYDGCYERVRHKYQATKSSPHDQFLSWFAEVITHHSERIEAYTPEQRVYPARKFQILEETENEG